MIYRVVGLFFVVLAAIGAVLPLLPTTPFLIVAAGCFAKSSPRLYQMLINNKVFGPLIIHWQASRSIPKNAKVMSLTMMVLAASWSCYMLEPWYLKLIVVALILGPFIFVARLPLANEQ